MSTGYYHGVSTQQAPTSIATPVTAASGVTFVVGTSPVQMNGDVTPEGGGLPVYKNVNEVIMGMNNAEAVTALGYSDDWKKYSLCEVMYTHYRLYATAPVFFVNVLDPAKHKTSVAAETYPLVDGRVKLTLDAIAGSVKVTDYTKGNDYDLFYDGEYLILISH